MRDARDETIRRLIEQMNDISRQLRALQRLDVSNDVNATNVGSVIDGATAKTPPVDADTMPLIDSAASNVLKKVTWANIKATLKTYFDTLYGLLATANTWTQVNTFSSRVDAPIVRANSASGLRLEDDAGSLGVFVEDSTGHVGVQQTSPQVPLHVGEGTDVPNATLADIMGYFTRNGNTSIVMRNATNNVELIVAAGSTAGVFGAVTNHDLRLRANNVDHVLISAGGNVGIGTTSPQGLIHAHDGTGGFLFVTKTGVAGTAVDIIPNGTGDVVRGVYLVGVVYNTTGDKKGVSDFVANGSSVVINGSPSPGTRDLTFAVAASGALTAQRTAGSDTWSISMCCTWL